MKKKTFCISHFVSQDVFEFSFLKFLGQTEEAPIISHV